MWPFLEYLRDGAGGCILKSPVYCWTAALIVRHALPYLLGPILLLDNAQPFVQVLPSRDTWIKTTASFS